CCGARFGTTRTSVSGRALALPEPSERLVKGALECFGVIRGEEHATNKACALIEDDVLHEVGPVQLERGPEALQLEVAFEESLEVRFGHLDALDLLERDGQVTEQRAELKAVLVDAVLLPEPLDRAFRHVDECITHSDPPNSEAG